MTAYAEDGTAQSRPPRGGRSEEDVLGGSVSIEELELAGTQPPRWLQDQVGERRPPSKVRY